MVFNEPFAQNENEDFRIRLAVKFMNVENSQTSGEVLLRLLSGVEGNEQMTFRIKRLPFADDIDELQKKNTTTMMEIDFYKGGSVWGCTIPTLSLNYSLSGEFYIY